MVKLNRTTEYALFILYHFNQNGKNILISTKEVAASYRLSFDLTARVMRALSHAKLLVSVQGLKGGYRLDCDLDRISFNDVIAAVSGPISLVSCQRTETATVCTISSQCVIYPAMNRMNEAVVAFFSEMSVGALLAENPLPSDENPDRLKGGMHRQEHR